MFHVFGSGFCKDCQSSMSARDKSNNDKECRENDEDDSDSDDDSEPDDGDECHQSDEEKPRKKARYPDPAGFVIFPQDSGVIPRAFRKRKGDFL